jgi:hypothetical protein
MNTSPSCVSHVLSDLYNPSVPLEDVLRQLGALSRRDPEAVSALLGAPSGAATKEPEPPPSAEPPGPQVFSAPPDEPFETDKPWHNFLSTQRVTPERLYRPSSLRDLKLIIQDALACGARVRAYGTGHSFSEVAVTRDYLVDTAGMQSVLPLPPLRPGESPLSYIHVEAGIKIRNLNAVLDQPNDGRALFNLGGYTGQSIIGAACTGTHGSGGKLGNMASMIASMVLVTETGTFRIEPADGPTDRARYREDGVDRLIQDDGIWNAVAVSVGSMGLVYSVIVRVRPKYLLHEVRTLTTWREVRPKLEDGSLFIDAVTQRPHRHVEVHINPHARGGDHTALVTIRNEFEGVIHGGLAGRNPLEAFFEAQPDLQRFLVHLLNTAPHRVPEFIDIVLGSMRTAGRAHWSYRILSADDTVDGMGCENAVTTRDGLHLRAVEEHFRLAEERARQAREYMSLISLRFVKRSRAYLAPQYDTTDTPFCMIEIPTPQGIAGAVGMFKAAGRRMMEIGGRPHWGLEFGVVEGLAEVRAMYPRAGDWLAIFQRLNPQGTFNSGWTRRMGFSR